ncbi:Nuclear factor related to kappa-B-binding [Melia azedarach]|uniref:Nuclear factor related to kappa-B-binding n=1 Tax=Melia azedarach TaxID=155640 RepID=A0ACC1YW82_MELAZ|nr:Nuclear factor related to kappa-B-binding [Melia azedarach]
MGIQKIGQHGVGSLFKQISDFNGKDVKMEKSTDPRVDLEDEFDDYELEEVGCELGMVEGKLCNIPYELFDLPNLREILSLETWNSCLTEEERFSLTAYLPDMDQQTFWLTMKELLGGTDMYFGNPLDTFFKRLKGGFYPPKVAYFRECLQFMQRRKYYHLLSSYHDNMAEIFNDMSRIWNQCDRSIGVQERIHMWRTRTKHRGNNLLDLNTIPEDGDFLCEETKSDAALHHLSKKINSLGGTRSDNIFSSVSANGMKFISPKLQCKGGSKIKSIFIWFSPKPLSKTLPGSGKGLVDCKISSLPSSVHFRDTGGVVESHLLRQKLGDIGVHRNLEEPHCALNQQESTIRNSRYSESSTSTRKIKREMNPSLEDMADFGNQKLSRSNVGRDSNAEYESSMDTMGAKSYNFSGKNLLQNLGLGSKGISESSFIQFPFKIQCYEGEWQIKSMREDRLAIHPRIPDVVSRMSDVAAGKQETFVASSSNQMKGQNDACVKISEKLIGQPSVSEGSKAEPALPLTYKRRKAQVKNSSLEFGKPLTPGIDLNSATSK